LYTYFVLSDIIGVINDVGPYEYASPTSPKKLRKIKIRNLEFVFPTTITTSFFSIQLFVPSPNKSTFFYSEQTQELVLWGHHGESFDENTVLDKSKEGIVIVIFAGVTAMLQKFTGD
jgi:replication factor A1